MTLRVLYISGNGFPMSESDARGVFSFEHAKALQAEGVAVTAVDLQREDFSEGQFNGLDILRLPRLRPLLKTLDFPRLRKYFMTLWRIRQEQEYDWIVFSFFYAKYIPFVLLLKRANTKAMIIAHGGDVMPVNLVRRWIKKFLYRSVHLVTPVSDYTETLLSCLVNRKNSDSKKIVTVYNGIDFDKLRQVQVPGQTLRAQCGFAAQDFVVLSVCNLVKRKGVDILVKSINGLLDRNLPIKHVIIGKGPELDALTALAREGGHFDCFRFISNVSTTELADYYNMCDVYSMISITDWDREQTEGFGIAYAEAMAHGKPVIGGGGCGSSTPVKHGFNGLLVDPYADTVVQDVAVALSRFLTDKEFYRQSSQNAKWYVENFTSWRSNAKATIAAMRRLDSPDVNSKAGFQA